MTSGETAVSRQVFDLKEIGKRWNSLRKSAVMFPAIGTFLAHGALIRIIERDLEKRRSKLIRNVSLYSRFALKQVGIEVRSQGHEPLGENFLIVSNHLSYVDMMVIASVIPGIFVTSNDMGEIFFLGTMADIGGSLFIERRHRGDIEKDIHKLSERLEKGFHVVLFPEGTSTCGDSVRPFKKSLLMSAVKAKKKILPLSLRYSEIDGRPFSIENRDTVCWYGEMGFLPHFLNLLSSRRIIANLKFHEPIEPAPSESKEELARRAHEAVASGYQDLK